MTEQLSRQSLQMYRGYLDTQNHIVHDARIVSMNKVGSNIKCVRERFDNLG